MSAETHSQIARMGKSLGNKRRRIGDPSDKEKDPDHIGKLTKIFGNFRDGETVPLKESIEAYFKREVLPHVPDACIDTTKTKVGYEISGQWLATYFPDVGKMVEPGPGHQRQRRDHNPAQGNALGLPCPRNREP